MGRMLLRGFMKLVKGKACQQSRTQRILYKLPQPNINDNM